ncbi:tRNA (adenosine(37)-N6)-threonylcarbamoyltransferase complex ATPase subunit type 1 TsaE [Candidatus Desantisbacteria bacterium CG1_02_38_46]|uniref:tRNA threonylcarbamoyladenosine biosynthesis protein TsaE n=2 Tax=unclassified Candidatus Desantisiibacteriota TaxID=3106372 RepID=A0A2H9PA34_9BACT|nr:MAG: tRNA (adenosine(37)-N6)-threonylcarbamoyltransferase complex ATPase subunit type 1 TsaE [Candidatus Desantisbacteria bacterium CG1_02_38_46]PIZ15165.1 MAG: tRNA (adenosine(37)-N6)-threonylcarbamoyltransferase complex ATPase subunit type 1 TsaE [Candidatus Desantisbacteria bacterium CG_4_10_14_0_8_um_filter_39_17]
MKIITNSTSETKKSAFRFAKKLKKGDILCLVGDLGSGKTTFVQGLAKGLGVKDIPTSPSFVLMNIYKCKLPLYHFDLYRLDNTDEIRNLGHEEFFYGDGITVVEWAEKLKELLPSKYIEVKFKILGKNKREILIVKKEKE